MRLQDDIFQVSFDGNGYTDRAEAGDFALLRAADTTIENGYRYFVVLDERDLSRSGSFTTPMSSQTRGAAQVRGNQLRYSETTQYHGGDTINFVLPNKTYMIRAFKEKPSTENMVFNAQDLSENLRKKYDIKSK